ncbi:MAG: N-glycosylase/DNA lyase [Candidatus Dadabacteria bacterium]|nr:N-glycosylase/DNA lyase [Candidatus Dadabacteria bacterium]NIQ13031.1 N-glycosylase/DNA lyase [Candidatus Dadabacteria bacterium]
MLHLEDILSSYPLKRPLIIKRLSEFENILKNASNNKIFEEMVYCILTAGASAKMGINALNSIRGVIQKGTEKEIKNKLKGIYRFPNIRSNYIVHTREYLKEKIDMDIKAHLLSYKDPGERRNYLALNKDIKGLGPKESSHFLRNIGFKGYAILDKHILNCLYELKVIESVTPPSSMKKYLAIEKKLKNFSIKNNIDFDEIDLLLWSEKTGEILK